MNVSQITAKATPENLRIIETLASLHPAEQYLFFGEVPALEACVSDHVHRLDPPPVTPAPHFPYDNGVAERAIRAS